MLSHGDDQMFLCVFQAELTLLGLTTGWRHVLSYSWPLLVACFLVLVVSLFDLAIVVVLVAAKVALQHLGLLHVNVCYMTATVAVIVAALLV